MASPAHCPKGHVYDDSNTYWQDRGNGTKTACCRACTRERMRRKRDANPSYSRDNMRRWRENNRERNNKNWTELRKAKREWLDEFKSKLKCRDCNESHPACLDFHHRDPSTKSFTIAEAIARASIERLQMEVEKCDILCSNCHRKLHYAERLS